MPHPRLLIIDDDEHLKEALELWFDRLNYKVEVAGDGQEGLLILRTERTIEVVLADFMMPALNGLELLQLLKSSTDLFHIKVLVMSHNENPEYRNRALQLGAIDYLSKADGAKSIVERTLQTLESRSAEPASSVVPTPGEIRLMSESLVNLLHVTGLTDGLPPSAKAAIVSAQELAERIHRLVI